MKNKETGSIFNLLGSDELRKLLEGIDSGKFETKGLLPEQRQAFLIPFMARRWSQVKLAKLFKVSRATIQKDMKKIKEEVGRSINFDQMIGDLVLTADTASNMAIKQGKPALFWRIKKELYEILFKSGCLSPIKTSESGITIESLAANYESVSGIISSAMDPSNAPPPPTSLRPHKPL